MIETSSLPDWNVKSYILIVIQIPRLLSPKAHDVIHFKFGLHCSRSFQFDRISFLWHTSVVVIVLFWRYIYEAYILAYIITVEFVFENACS